MNPLRIFRRPTLAFCLVALAPACATTPQPVAAPAAVEEVPWQDLNDISLWETQGTATWRIEDGAIVSGQDGDPSRAGLLATKTSFQNFELQLEFMIDEHGKYNSGVYLRTQPGLPKESGYQINLGRGAAKEYCGGIYTDHWLATGDENDEVRKVLAWNTLVIHAEGPHIRVILNGVEVVNFVDPSPEPARLTPGAIALQTYGADGHDGWVKFRNIRVRPL